MIRKLKLKLLVAVVLLNGPSHGADEYMGSSVSWRVLDHTNDDQILVKATFRKVYGFDCKDPSSWSCYNVTSGSCSTLYNSSWECTDDSPHYISTSSVKFVQTTDDSITYRQSGDEWIENTFNRPTATSIPFSMNLERRKDSGKPNSSPVTFVPSYTRFITGCPMTIRIPTFDEDDDDVTCRYGNNNLENGDVINDYPYFALDKENCELKYNGGGSIWIYVPVTIIVEDHPKSDSTTNNSFTSLQFGVEVAHYPNPSDYCGKYPIIEQPTELQKFDVKSGEEFHLVVKARAYLCCIHHIQINGAAQMTSDFSSPVFLGNNLYQLKFTWIPEADDKGENFVCFTAYDDALHSDQRCVIINVDGTAANDYCDPNPCENGGTCSLVVEGYSCSCQDGFGGDVCSIDYCDANLCHNGGSCIREPDSSTCSCPAGFAGDDCSEGNCDVTSCTDACEMTSTSNYTCSCFRSCWQLASDMATCIPNLETTCSEERIQVQVKKCGVDGDVILGDYDPNVNVPAECLPTETSDYYDFDIAVGQCQSSASGEGNEKREQVLVKMWIEDPKQDTSSPITRGSWYKVQVTCDGETSFNVSGSFDPEDSSTTIVTEDGFGQILLNFDFYTDSTFQSPYGSNDYPVKYNLEDDIYFGIVAQTNDSDVELFTKSCRAVAEPNPQSVQPYPMITNGCLMDETMQVYPSTDPLKNHFSIQAFRFKTSLPGMTEDTNVRIECEVVVCVEMENVTTSCTNQCATLSSDLPHSDLQIVSRDKFAAEWSEMKDGDKMLMRSNGEMFDGETTDGEPVETSSIPLKKSPPIRLIEADDNDGSQGGGSGSIHLNLTQAIFIVFLSFIIRT